MAWSNAAIERGADYLDEWRAENPTAVGASFNRAAGSDPNEEHLEGGGYHVYYDSLPNGGRYDYSSGLPTARNTNPRDALPTNPPHESAAWDLGYDEDDMVAVSQRIQAAIDRRDPAMDNVREVNLWFGGDADPVNRDHELGWEQNYVPAASHKGHIHVAWYRDVADDWDVIEAFCKLITGASPEEEEDMPLNDTDLGKIKALIQAEGNNTRVWTRQELKRQLSPVAQAFSFTRQWVRDELIRMVGPMRVKEGMPASAQTPVLAVENPAELAGLVDPDDGLKS